MDCRDACSLRPDKWLHPAPSCNPGKQLARDIAVPRPPRCSAPTSFCEHAEAQCLAWRVEGHPVTPNGSNILDHVWRPGPDQLRGGASHAIMLSLPANGFYTCCYVSKRSNESAWRMMLQTAGPELNCAGEVTAAGSAHRCSTPPRPCHFTLCQYLGRETSAAKPPPLACKPHSPCSGGTFISLDSTLWTSNSRGALEALLQAARRLVTTPATLSRHTEVSRGS